MFRKWIGFFRRNDLGQDLAEYCLMTAIIALIGLGIFYQFSGGFQNLWGPADSAIVAASTAASPGAAVQSTGPVHP
jgi:Flp pilus assembly pilin Flp